MVGHWLCVLKLHVGYSHNLTYSSCVCVCACVLLICACCCPFSHVCENYVTALFSCPGPWTLKGESFAGVVCWVQICAVRGQPVPMMLGLVLINEPWAGSLSTSPEQHFVGTFV